MKKATITNLDEVPFVLRDGLKIAVETMDFSVDEYEYWNSFIYDGKTYDVNIYQRDDENDDNWYGALSDTVAIEGEDFLDQGSVIACFKVQVEVE